MTVLLALGAAFAFGAAVALQQRAGAGVPHAYPLRSALLARLFRRPVWQYRRYIYVEDLADGHARCLHEAASNQVINLEGPAPISIRDIIESIQQSRRRRDVPA